MVFPAPRPMLRWPWLTVAALICVARYVMPINAVEGATRSVRYKSPFDVPSSVPVSIFQIPEHCMKGTDSRCTVNPIWSSYTVDCEWAVDHRWAQLIAYNDDWYNPAEVHDTTTSSCQSGSDWYAFKWGPITTEGGDHGFGGANVSLFAETSDYGSPTSDIFPEYVPGILAVRDYMLGSLDAANRVVTYPPVQQHHFHVYQGGGWFNQEVMSTHADNYCSESEGGVLCNMRRSPPGYAFMLRSSIGAISTISDVRPPNSAPMTTWCYAALRLALAGTPIRQHLLQYIYPIPAEIFDQSRLMGFTAQSMGERAASKLDYSTETVAWLASSLVAGTGPTFECFAHIHSSGNEDLWLFEGTAEQVFGDDPRFQKAGVTRAVDIAKDAVRVIDMRSRQDNPATFVCSVRAEAAAEGGEYQGEVLRRARCPLHTGMDKWVAVFLQKASVNPNQNIHAEFWLYFAMDGPENFAIVRPSLANATHAYDKVNLVTGETTQMEDAENLYLSV